ncbi:YqaJ viral recombinase family protein [Sphingopyxis indica]|uniref:lambda-exonuclease family protein n=1 Tax=Sphingopyxis indica TaxID=436663 RepID=UPI0029392808|nr:YqaJ viral recombinase family protein [Sphingopyxis indica]WOF42866.1 YqaJ viral recombinase family protein [Sphingopyxis indica]
MPFDIVDLDQGNADWLKWRAGGIGASDAPAIMRENPWKSPAALRHEKLRPHGSRPVNAAMARGTALEPAARALYCDRRKVEVSPRCIQSRARPWMRASLDGICAEHRILVEIKCGESAYRTASRHRAVPRYYYGQLQHALAVSGCDAIDFWCYLPGKQPLLIEVPRDEPYIRRMIDSEYRFWSAIEADVLKALSEMP